ncbi:hypothetical protein SPFM15_00002 [Salmonella phage SPFM15]|nr:hypothetical protein SPFM15_00002 [Salmonella phage SPFM15]
MPTKSITSGQLTGQGRLGFSYASIQSPSAVTVSIAAYLHGLSSDTVIPKAFELRRVSTHGSRVTRTKSDISTVRIRPFARPICVTLTGSSPVKARAAKLEELTPDSYAVNNGFVAQVGRATSSRKVGLSPPKRKPVGVWYVECNYHGDFQSGN